MGKWVHQTRGGDWGTSGEDKGRRRTDQIGLVFVTGGQPDWE